MNKSWLTARQLAALLNVSVKTVRRAYRNGEIPIVRFRRMVRFDLEHVQQAMQGHVRPHSRDGQAGMASGRAAGGTRRRRAEPDSPRSVKRGRNFQSSPRRDA